MCERKYSGVNDRKPYPVDMVAFKDGDSVSDLKVENGELKLNGEPVGGGSGGGEGGVSSWNDLTDKPFGDMEVVLAAEKTFSKDAGTNQFTDLNSSMVTDGQELVVRFDGVRYTCKVKDWGDDIGLATDNYADMMAGTSELPFCLIFKSTQTNISVTSSGEHTASVYAVETVKMPGKYLPEGLPYTEGGGMAEILPEATYDNNDGLMITIPLKEDFVIGEHYIVNVNGVEYSATGLDGNSMGYPINAILNDEAITNDGLDESKLTALVIASTQELEPGLYGMAMIPNIGATCTLSVYKNGETVYKLYNKYLDLDWLPTITYRKGETLFEEATVTTSSSSIDGFDGAISLGFSIDMSKEQVCVTIDGKDYICDVMAEAGGYVIPVGSTFETALFMIYGQNLFHRNAGTYTIKITDYVTNYNKLPEGFLPSGSKTKYYFDLSSASRGMCKDSAMTESLNSSELAKAWNNGEVVLVDIGGGTEYKAIAFWREEVTIMAEINDEIVPVKLSCQLD